MSAPAWIANQHNLALPNLGPERYHTSERFLTPCDYDGPNILILIVFGEGIVDLFEERAGKGIEGFRAVQCDYHPSE